MKVKALGLKKCRPKLKKGVKLLSQVLCQEFKSNLISLSYKVTGSQVYMDYNYLLHTINKATGIYEIET